MTEHPTLGPTDTVHLRADEPSAAADITADITVDIPAAFTDLVCADHELLRAEFDAIITANFPDAAENAQRLDPTVPIATRTDRGTPRRWPTPPSQHPQRSGAAGAQHLPARQRGPPRPRRNTSTGTTTQPATGGD